MIDLVAQKKPDLTRLCRQFHVRRMDVFGSAAKGSFDPIRSDLDFVITLDSESPTDYAENYFQLAEELEKLFGRHVDLVTENSIRNPFFRRVIDQSRECVYEA